MTLTLDDLKARARQEVAFTIECSGNSSAPFFLGGVGNAIWAGTPLSSLLEDVGVLEEGIEVVFWGADAGEQTYRDVTVTEHFARSMSLADAMAPDNLIAFEMNGQNCR
jgi:DMSO/TMAO reductase YedYZ molybdopterin-dependent catalytic subunit